MEYYSTKDRETQQDYLERMQSFLMDKKVIKIMKESISPNCTPKGSSSTRNSKKTNLVFNVEINTLNFMNTKEKKINAKEIVQKFEKDISKTREMMENVLKSQKTKFLENLQIRIYKRNTGQSNGTRNSSINNTSRTQSYIKRKTIDHDFNGLSPLISKKSIFEQSPLIKKLDFGISNIQNESLEKLASLKLLQGMTGIVPRKSFVSSTNLNRNFTPVPLKRRASFIKNDRQQLCDIIEEYINKIHSNFFKNSCEEAIKQTLQVVNLGFTRKWENHLEYTNQKSELEALFYHNPSKFNFILR